MPAESEWLTRKRRIDPRLAAAGWVVVPYVDGMALGDLDHHAIEEYPTTAGPADYALLLDGQIVGVVEAKRYEVGAGGILPQAERYSKGLAESSFDFRGFRAPFLYASNGENIRYWDVRHELNLSRPIGEFHTPTALREFLDRDVAAACAVLAATPNDHQRLREYQREANDSVESAIAAKRRQMLVAMATGTGKTFTTVNQVYRLLKAGVAKRVLFLVDRRALAAQAVRAFASFEPEPGLKFDKIYEVYSQRFQKEDFGEDEPFDPSVLPTTYLTDPNPGHTFVYVCTIQRMAISILGKSAIFDAGNESLDGDEDQLDIPIHAFDVIIADECHRGYTAAQHSVWRSTLDHFDAIKIGLTATPAAHTKAYFRDVVFRYEYERAVREGFLVDYDVVNVKSNVHLDGLFLNEGEEVQFIDPESGGDSRDLLEDEREFANTEVESKVTSPDANRRIVRELKRYTDEHEQRHGRFPKTLIFAQNDLPHTSHSDQLADLCREEFGRGEEFVEKITGRVDRPLQKIREFRNRRKPGIVVTVDLLSTGVDIPDLEFIVFLRPVKSRILFEQMLGRGTRRGEQFPDKSHFVVFDCFDGSLLEHFRNSTAITAAPPDRPTRTIAEIIEDIWQNRDRDYNVRCLVKRLHRVEKEMSGDARGAFAAFGIEEGDVGKYARELPAKLSRDFSATMELLRNEELQAYLVAYPRRKDPFVVAVEHEGEVSSEWLVRDGQGKEHKPEDYLQAFGRFVEENVDEVDAIRILLDRPEDWRTDALAELRQKLTAAPERFTVDNLQKAHAACYKKQLVEIISMVKHAADERQELLTAEERVERALATVAGDLDLTDEQRAWLDRIRAHLVENLTIDVEDFDFVPVLHDAGGWGRANRDFGGRLATLLAEINRAIAA